MRLVNMLICACALVACAAKAPPPAPSAAPPEAALRAVYDAVSAPNGAGRPSLDLVPLSDDLKAQLDHMDAVSKARDEPILDFDPVTDSQDGRVTDVTLAPEAPPLQHRAVVDARFKLEGEAKLIRYDMVFTEAAGWRVDNIRTDEWDLRKLISDGVAAPAEAQSCESERGAAAARTLVQQCLQVSPATHPPCNAANACAMIQSEIDRGCGLLTGNKPVFCR